MAQHKHANAAVVATCTLDPQRIAEIAEEAAGVATSGLMGNLHFRLEDAKPGQLTYALRSRVTGDRVEVMVIRLTVTVEGDRSTVRSRILRYKTRRQLFLGVIPGPARMLGWAAYSSFMKGLADRIRSADQSAQVSIVTKAA